MAETLHRSRRPNSPGVILRGMFLEPRQIGVKAFAELVEVSPKHASQILNGHVRLNAELAARIGKVCGNGAAVWLRLQAAVDAWDAERAMKGWRPRRTL